MQVHAPPDHPLVRLSSVRCWPLTPYDSLVLFFLRPLQSLTILIDIPLNPFHSQYDLRHSLSLYTDEAAPLPSTIM
jgi:hypothetical protein